MNAFEGKISFSSKDDSGENTAFLVPCTYQTDGENAVLSFIEPKGENDVATRSRIYMEGERISIRRQGDMIADFCFVKDEKTKLKYVTAQGTLEFEINTLEQKVEFDDDSAYAKVVYDLYYGGEKTARTTVEYKLSR